MINAVVFGNVGSDAVLNKTKDGTDVLSFSVACNRKRKGEDETMWVRCSMYGHRARPLADYIVKGAKVGVSGRLWAYMSESNGKTFLNVDMTADEVELCYIPGRASSPVGDAVEESAEESDEIPF